MRLLFAGLLIVFLCGATPDTRPMADADYWLVIGDLHCLVGKYMYYSELPYCLNKDALKPKHDHDRRSYTCIVKR